MANKKDYYNILGVDKNVNADDLKKAYRKLSLKWHPDKWANKSEQEKKNAEDKFKEIAEAYSVLSDENKRKHYDMFGTVDGMNFSTEGSFDPFEMFRNMGGFSNFANDFFGNRQEKKTIKKGKSIKFTTKVTLEEIYNNSKHTIKYKRFKPCKECNGKGSKSGKVDTCPHCHGSGRITQTYRNGFMTSIQEMVCPHCHGSGTIITNPCPHCHGSGLELVEETYTFEVPIGCTDNTYIVIEGAGNYPERCDGVNGDLQLVFSVQPNDRYAISENNPFNLMTAVEVPILDCITGCDIKIKNVNGEDIDVNIKPCTKHDTKIVIPNKGFKTPYNRRGDIIVYVRQRMPSNLSKDDQKLISKLKKSNNFK